MKMPPPETPVIVTMDDGTEFKAVRIRVVGESEWEDCWTWMTADEFEPKCPECWDDGVCWGSNSANRPSRAPVAWRALRQKQKSK